MPPKRRSRGLTRPKLLKAYKAATGRSGAALTTAQLQAALQQAFAAQSGAGQSGGGFMDWITNLINKIQHYDSRLRATRAPSRIAGAVNDLVRRPMTQTIYDTLNQYGYGNQRGGAIVGMTNAAPRLYRM